MDALIHLRKVNRWTDSLFKFNACADFGYDGLRVNKTTLCLLWLWLGWLCDAHHWRPTHTVRLHAQKPKQSKSHDNITATVLFWICLPFKLLCGKFMTAQLGAIYYGDMIIMTSKHIMMDALCQRCVYEWVVVDRKFDIFMFARMCIELYGRTSNDRYTQSNKKINCRLIN